MCRIVVLPAPLGPSRPVMPGPSAKVMSFTATTGPYQRETRSRTIGAVWASAGASAEGSGANVGTVMPAPSAGAVRGRPSYGERQEAPDADHERADDADGCGCRVGDVGPLREREVGVERDAEQDRVRAIEHGAGRDQHQPVADRRRSQAGDDRGDDARDHEDGDDP